MNTLKKILTDHYTYRRQIWKLALTDLKKEYKGALLGPFWLFLKPAIRIFVYYFAFAIGLRQGAPVEGYPKFLWLLAGLIPWFYMQSMIPGGSSSLRRYTYLITKIKYPISTIPTFVNLSEFLIHMMLVGATIVIFCAFGYMPDIYLLQLPVYMLLAFLFLNFWGLFSSLLGVISKDYSNLIKSFITALFWLSGIMWNPDTIGNELVRKLLNLNPVTFLVNGFRNCFINKIWFWEQPKRLIYFLIITVIFLILAIATYKKLRKDIPDVL